MGDSKTDAIFCLPLFGGVCRADVAEIARLADEVDVKAGTVLWRESERADWFAVVVDGVVRVSREGRELADLETGEFLGERSLVIHQPRTTRAVCMVDTRLLVFGAREFSALLDVCPDIRRRVLEKLAGRLASEVGPSLVAVG